MAIIPARGGSKGIHLKNIANVAGKPLIYWTIKAAVDSNKFDDIIVTTDNHEIAEYASGLGAYTLKRPKILALDDTPTLPVVQHAYASYAKAGKSVDYVATLQPTSPLRTATHIKEAVQLIQEYPNADSLVSVQRVPHNFNPDSLFCLDNDILTSNQVVPCSRIFRRQEKPIYWARNGAALYFTKVCNLGKFIWGGETLLYRMDKLSSLDIDDSDDLRIADLVLRSL
ncbi:MAG: acylneuraminate cytidylyltransferase family protein [Cyanobium usitatum Tobar12.5m-G36]|nr:acylneuraminate cytidylyltransferase family protein [Cyanobium usitatum Tobar12.5m-G36]